MDNATQNESAPPVSQFEATMNERRASALVLEKDLRAVVANGHVKGEAAAQAMLAVRHLEDARMRMGKVIQYAVGGGVSCWDSDRKPGDDGR